jgi:dihydrolipoamide dehydrogenase
MVVGSLTVETDVVVIGAGPGGYVAAIRAAQLGFEVMVIDSQKGLGGVCLQEGCIPTKALISASDYAHAIQNIEMMGIEVSGHTVKVEKMMAWKQGVINKMNSGIANLFSKYGIEVIEGKAEFYDDHTIHISGQSDINTLKFKHAIIATGSLPIDIPGFAIDGTHILGSKEALCLTQVPKSVVIIGGGYIGTELSTVLGKLGCQVHLFEMGDRLIPMLDPEIVSVVQKKISNFGVTPHFNVKAQKGEVTQNGVTVTYIQDNQTKTIDVEKVIVVVGRKPNATALGLEKIGIQLDSHKFIPVNEKLQTVKSHIYAVGDVAGQPMLAHKAERQGKVAAECIAGLPSAYDNKVCPSVVFNDPELMSVGMTFDQAQQAGFTPKQAKFPLTALAKSYFANPSTVDGFVKLIIDEKTGLILGCHGVGPKVSEIVSEVTLAIELGATAEDIAATIHPHPTMSESIMEVADTVMGQGIHVFSQPPKKK